MKLFRQIAESGRTVVMTTHAMENVRLFDKIVVLMGGKLAKHPQSGLGISSADGSQSPVEWPFRYSARVEFGRVILLDETGKVVAREGDEITVGVGASSDNIRLRAPVTVTKAGS